jgi:hypothetical protein
MRVYTITNHHLQRASQHAAQHITKPEASLEDLLRQLDELGQWVFIKGKGEG